MNVQMKGFDEFEKRLRNSQQNVARNMVTAIKTCVTIVTIAAKFNAPVSTGALRRSVGSEVNEKEMFGRVGLDYPGKTYGKYVERGTSAHWVPIEAISRWSAQKGISAYAIQRSIARKGTKAHPFMIPAYEKNKTFISRQFVEALKGTIKSFTNGNG